MGPNRDACRERMRLACEWLADVAQVRSDGDVAPGDRKKHHQLRWVGAMRGEYRAAARKWSFFCPVWHTGQAVKALVLASDELGDRFIDSAVLGGEFILGNRILDGSDRGLILAFEDRPDRVNTSAILECVDGLFVLSDRTGDARFADAALDAIDWVQRTMVLPGTGLVRDLYDPVARTFHQFPNTEGRPLADDAAFLSAHRRTGRPEYLDTARAITDRLLADEDPPGNWVGYIPCHRPTGSIHPRHAYWWGRPMLAMYEQTGDERCRSAFLRASEWYRRALRRDGGLIRNTYTDFTADSFGHATSGVGAAVLMFLDARARLGEDSFLPSAELGLSYCMRMQFTDPKDPNLCGSVLEKVLPPDGTDASPYHIRDLGTIFFVQAAAQYLGGGDAGH